MFLRKQQQPLLVVKRSCWRALDNINIVWIPQHRRCCRSLHHLHVEQQYPRWQVDPTTGWVTESNSNSNNNNSDMTTKNKKRPIYQVVVGLEIHAQLNVPTKLFSPAKVGNSNSSSNQHCPPNTAVHPFDLAVPGMLPVLSQAAVRCAVLVAAALHCTIAPTSRFERKHYVYADLPHGYQITQQRWPLATNGRITCSVPLFHHPNNHKINHHHHQHAAANHGVQQQQAKRKVVQCRVNRIQLEQDTGKTVVSTRYTIRNNGTPVTATTTFDLRTTKELGTPPAETADEMVVAETVSRVDYNRAGTALVEIVTDPDLRSSAEAGAVVRTVQQILRHTGTCHGKMEAGQLRVDCNVNLIPYHHVGANHHPDHDWDDENEVEFHTNVVSSSLLSPAAPPPPPKQQISSLRVEIKNLNSIQQVEDCINYEACRQAELLWQSDDPVMPKLAMVSETRTWNAVTAATELLRRKDADDDYRFLPEPDLPPVVLNESVLGSLTVEEFLEQNLRELPAAAIARLVITYGLSDYLANVIAGDPPAIAFFDRAMSVVLSTTGLNRTTNEDLKSQGVAIATVTANLLCNELFALIKDHHSVVDGVISDADSSSSVEFSKVSAQQLGEVVLMIKEGRISSTTAKKLLAVLYTEGCYAASPRQVAADRGLTLITDVTLLKEICQTVIAQHPDELKVYRRGGKFVTKMQKLFTGKAMAESRGNAHPERLREVVCDCLAEAAASVAANESG